MFFLPPRGLLPGHRVVGSGDECFYCDAFLMVYECDCEHPTKWRRMDLVQPETPWQPLPCCIEVSYNHDGAYYSGPRSTCTSCFANLSGTSGRWRGPPGGWERTHRRCCKPPPTVGRAGPWTGLATDLSHPQMGAQHPLPDWRGLEGSRPCGTTLDVSALASPEEDCGRSQEHELRLHKLCSWTLSRGSLGCQHPPQSGWILPHCQKWTQSQSFHTWKYLMKWSLKTTTIFV